MGMTLEESVKVRQLADYPEKIGFCLDTCHLFAAGGWDISNTDELLPGANRWAIGNLPLPFI